MVSAIFVSTDTLYLSFTILELNSHGAVQEIVL